jgi:hypothetical protein
MRWDAGAAVAEQRCIQQHPGMYASLVRGQTRNRTVPKHVHKPGTMGMKPCAPQPPPYPYPTIPCQRQRKRPNDRRWTQTRDFKATENGWRASRSWCPRGLTAQTPICQRMASTPSRQQTPARTKHRDRQPSRRRPARGGDISPARTS